MDVLVYSVGCGSDVGVKALAVLYGMTHCVSTPRASLELGDVSDQYAVFLSF